LSRFPEEGEISVNWDEFALKIQELRELHSSRKVASPLLFRGHADAEWKLQTTLERRNTSNMLFRDYYLAISRIKPQIEAFTKQLWGTPDIMSVMRLLEDYDAFSLELDNGNFPASEYMDEKGTKRGQTHFSALKTLDCTPPLRHGNEG